MFECLRLMETHICLAINKLITVITSLLLAHAFLIGRFNGLFCLGVNYVSLLIFINSEDREAGFHVVFGGPHSLRSVL